MTENHNSPASVIGKGRIMPALPRISAVSKNPLQGARYPDHLKDRVGR
jgi:hypothetical protein